MAAWMVAATLFAALLGVAALAAERGLRTVGREARGAWIAALGAAVCWPAIAPAVATAVAALTRRESRGPIEAVGTALSTVGAAVPHVSRGWVAYVDVALVAIWAVASFVLFVRLVWAMRILAGVERSADREIIDGVPVLVTPALGPAVFGTRRARVLVPRWLLDLDEPLRALVLRHEQEHCRARDPQVTLALAAAAVLMPWNAGVWWIAQRLRLAVELDCDQRVLRDVEDPERYGKLLLFIAQRQSVVRLAPMLAESNSHLSRRIAAMNAQRPTHGRARVAALAAVAVLALAFSTRYASELTAAPSVSIPKAIEAPRIAAAVPAPVVASPTPAPLTKPKVTQEKSVAIAVPSPIEPKAEVVLPNQDDDRPVRAIPGFPSPRYPQSLKDAGVDGAVLVAFVVDTFGLADPQSLKILKSTNPLFSEAVAAALPNMRFLPAILNNRKVKQAVRQPIVFNMVNSPLASAEGQRATLEQLMSNAPLDNFYTLSVIVITAVTPR